MIKLYWVGQKVRSGLSTNKRHSSFSPRALLNNVFINQTNFLANPIYVCMYLYTHSPILLPKMEGSWEDPTCRGATKPISHNY